MNGLMSAMAALLLITAASLGVVLADGPAIEDSSHAAFDPQQEQPDGARNEVDVPGWVSAEARALIEMSMRADQDGPNDYQEGENGDCADYNALYMVDGVDSPLAAVVEVDPGTGYVVDSSAGAAHIDFRNEDGDNLGYNELQPNGNVPEGAVYGILCIALTNSYPDAPEAFATWFFMDGFPKF